MDEWKSDDLARIQEAREAMDQLREQSRHLPKGHLLAPITVKRAREALGAFKGNTAIGTDGTSFHELAFLPDEALEELVQIMRGIVESLEWPAQAYTNMFALLGKSSGGTRCICIAPTIYRLTMAMCKSEVREWDVKAGQLGIML